MKDKWCGALVVTLLLACISCRTNSRDADDSRHDAQNYAIPLRRCGPCHHGCSIVMVLRQNRRQTISSHHTSMMATKVPRNSYSAIYTYCDTAFITQNWGLSWCQICQHGYDDNLCIIRSLLVFIETTIDGSLRFSVLEKLFSWEVDNPLSRGQWLRLLVSITLN